MKQGRVTGAASQIKDRQLTADLKNPTDAVVLMVRLKLVDLATGLLAAPVLYSDNYFSLAPGESRSIGIDLRAIQPGATLKLMVEGWNIAPAELAPSIKL